MDFSHSEKVRLLQEQMERFMNAHIYPAERSGASTKKWRKTVTTAIPGGPPRWWRT